MFKIILFAISFAYMTSDLKAQVKGSVSTTQKDSIIGYKPAAMYNKGISELANCLQKKYASKKIKPVKDSFWVFKAFVDQQELNELQRITLIEGTKSEFSDFILQGLKDSGKNWRPMIQSGRLVKSYIKVCVR